LSSYASEVAQAVATRYVVVCRGPNCRERGGMRLRKRLVQLFKGEAAAQLVGYACFGQCDFGPNVLFFPEGEFYGGFADGDAAERIFGHAVSARPFDRQPLTLPEDERRQHLANVAELVDTLERDRARGRGRRWWWPF
jgi:(2Fe-2S) ferredoxin